MVRKGPKTQSSWKPTPPSGPRSQHTHLELHTAVDFSTTPTRASRKIPKVGLFNDSDKMKMTWDWYIYLYIQGIPGPLTVESEGLLGVPS